MASLTLHISTHTNIRSSCSDDSHTGLSQCSSHTVSMMVGQQPLPTTSETKHCCSSRASPAIGHDGPEPLFKGQSLQWLHGSLKRHAGEALQHGDMLDARLDGADDT